MIFALTSRQAAEVEERAVASGELTIASLMDRAGAALGREAAAIAPSGRIVVVVGKGNNGGDGWVAARELHDAGREVEVLSLVAPDELAGVAEGAARHAIEASVPWRHMTSIPELTRELADAALVIDAVFGFGFRGPARDPFASVLAVLDETNAPVLAADVPSGVDADTGAVDGDAVHASVTLTFTAPKTGLLQYPGAAYAGELHVADIGVPREGVEAVATVEVPDRGDYLGLFPFARPDDHKGSRGRVLVVGGSTGMTGACVLAASAALRMGAGYVRLAVPASLLDVVACKLTCVVFTPLPETHDCTLAAAGADTVLELAAGYDAVVLGPGLSTHEETAGAARRLVRELDLPLVVDADALNAIAGDAAPALGERRAATLLTPHPGELGRLLGMRTSEVQADRLSAGACLAHGPVACMLKGARTIVSGEGRQIVNLSGNAGMATAGSGDVLAGLAGALMAQGLSALEAGVLGAYLHGRAGDAAATKLTETCVTAQDVLGYLPRAVRELLGG